MQALRARIALSGFTRADRRAVFVLVVVPVVMFGLPTILGHPPITQDNLIQNFPLRSLSGAVMRSGHLPTWNRLIFGGSPLLGALNAGAFYPLTFAFVVLGDMLAWLVNIVSCYWAAGLGLYALARWLKVAPIPALLGALTYAYLGMMTGQLVHLAVIQGQGWLPWFVLLVLMVGDRLRGSDSPHREREAIISSGWPLVGLVVIVALVFLTGEPRAIADLEIVAMVVVGYVVIVPASRTDLGRRLLVAGVIGVATVWGILCSAAQLLPGQEFISLSQRSNLTYWFFGSGSLALNRTILVAIPDFFGGVGLLHQPYFFVSYNISELNGYVGILGLAGFGAVLGGLVGRRRRGQPMWLWLVAALTVVGMLTAWGTFTPFGHVMHAIPLLNRTRLQSRNLVVVDLAAGLAVAWFVDRMLAGDREGASLRRWRGWLTSAPLLATMAVALWAIVAPVTAYAAWGVTPDEVGLGRYMLLWLVAPVVLCGALLTIMRYVDRCSPRRIAQALALLFVVDATVFFLGTSTGLVGGNTPTKPSAAYAASTLGTTGRFALLDPNLAHEDQFIALGKPDTNAFTGLPSVQGYGSLIGASYGQATGAHVQNGLAPCQLAAGRFDQLRLKTLVVAAGSLAPSGGTPLELDGSGISLPLPQVTCDDGRSVADGRSRQVYFGQAIEVRTIVLTARSPQVMADAALAGSLRVSGITLDGRPTPLHTTVSSSRRGWIVEVTGRPTLGGLRVSGPIHKVMDASAVVDVSGRVTYLGGLYQDAIDGSAWRLIGTEGTLQSFTRTAPLVPNVLLEGAPRSSAVLSSTARANGGEVDVVHLTGAATLVRSESMLTGWTASVAPAAGGPAHEVAVEAHDLVQSIRVPAGNWRITFHYEAPGVVAGLAVSVAATVGLGLVAIGLLVRGRRRGADRVRS